MFHHIARSYATIPIWQRWLLDGLVVRCMIWYNLKIKISRHCNHFSFAVSWSDNGCMMTVGWAWHERYNLITDATVVGHGATRPAGNPITMTTTNILSMSDIIGHLLVYAEYCIAFWCKTISDITLLHCAFPWQSCTGQRLLASESVTFLLFVSKFLLLLRPLILCGGARDFSTRQGKYPCWQLLEHEHMRETNIWFVGLTRCGNK